MVREALPGANCGACGQSDVMRLQSVVNKQSRVNGCPVGGQEVADKIGEIPDKAEAVSKKRKGWCPVLETCKVKYYSELRTVPGSSLWDPSHVFMAVLVLAPKACDLTHIVENGLPGYRGKVQGMWEVY